MTTKKDSGTLRIAVYLRFSQDRTGEGLGMARHEPRCRELAQKIAAQNGAAAQITVYRDNDISASRYSRKKRKAYIEMCERIERGDIDVVVAYHHDRLLRDKGREMEPFIDLIERNGVDVQFVTAGRWDLSTAAGRFQARIAGSVAAYESELKSERIKLQRIQQAMAGKFHGGIRPYGFEPDGVTVRADEAREIARMYEQVVAGVTLRQIVRDLNTRGVPTATQRGPWTSQAVRDIIRRPRNAGWSVHNGEVVGKAEWAALVSEDTWQAAVAVVSDPARRTSPGNTPKWLGSGLYLCGVCDRPELRVSAASSNRNKVYRCRSRELTGVAHVNRDAARLDALVEETIVSRLEQPDALAQLAAGFGPTGVDVAALRLEQAALRQRLDALATMFAAGEIDARQLATASTSLKAKITAMDGELAEAGRRSPLAELAGSDIRARWFGTQPDRSDGLSLGTRRAIVDMLLTVRVLPAPKGRRANGVYFDPSSIEMTWKM